jgi:molecular chaperone DnaJ
MDFYIILGVARGASIGDIKRAYRRLARKLHPDVNPGDRTAAAQFRQILEAYETLSDPDRRRRYDSAGHEAAAAADTAIGFEGFDFSVSVGGPSAPTFGDLFAEIFRPRGMAADEASERGTDLHHTVTIGFEEAVRGGQHLISVTRQEHCRTCHGAGRLQTAESRCLHCHGSGTLRSARGHMVFSRTCAYCGGSGRQRADRCPACAGGQVETRTEALTIAMPAGLAEGVRIRVAGKGNVGRSGGETGDLYVTVHVEPHPLFRREGDDIHLLVPVAVHEAALGAKFEVPSLDGPVRVRVPPGTQSGQRFRFRERGVLSAHHGRRGDLVVEVRLVLPKLLDERSKELLREFGRINAEDARAGLMDHPGHHGQDKDVRGDSPRVMSGTPKS